LATKTAATRRAPKTPQTKEQVLNRLRSVRGHIDAVIRMVEEDTYCIDVIKQISALRAALDRVGRIELRNHFEHCFANAVRSGESRAAVDELIEALSFKKDLF